MDNEILITAAFLGAGLPACMIIPGMLVIWNRVLNHMEWGKTKIINERGGGLIPCLRSWQDLHDLERY